MTAPTITDCQGTWRSTYRESNFFQEVLRCDGCSQWMVIVDPTHSYTVDASSFDEAVEAGLAAYDAQTDREAIEAFLEQQAQDDIIDADDSVEVSPIWDEPESYGCECEIDWDCGCGSQARWLREREERESLMMASGRMDDEPY